MSDKKEWPSVSFTRIGLMVGVPFALLFGSGLLAIAATPVKMWNAGETLTAADLNASFTHITDNMVDTTTDQTIGGVKTFTGAVVATPTHVSVNKTTPFATSSLTFVPVTGMSATLTTHGKPVLVTVSANHNATAVPTTGATSWAVWTIFRDGTNLGQATYGMQITEHYLGMNMPISFTFVDTPPAGAHTYVLQMHVGGAGMTVEMGEAGQTQQISATELN